MRMHPSEVLAWAVRPSLLSFFFLLSPFLLFFACLFLNLLGPILNEALHGFPVRHKAIVDDYDYTLHEDPYVDEGMWYTFTSDSHDYHFEECIRFQSMSVHDGCIYFNGEGLHRIEVKSGKEESLKQLPAGIELEPIDVFFKQLPEGPITKRFAMPVFILGLLFALYNWWTFFVNTFSRRKVPLLPIPFVGVALMSLSRYFVIIERVLHFKEVFFKKYHI